MVLSIILKFTRKSLSELAGRGEGLHLWRTIWWRKSGGALRRIFEFLIDTTINYAKASVIIFSKAMILNNFFYFLDDSKQLFFFCSPAWRMNFNIIHPHCCKLPRGSVKPHIILDLKFLTCCYNRRGLFNLRCAFYFSRFRVDKFCKNVK